MGGEIGSYRIVRKLGEGGMGTVYLGEHVLLGRKAAIKVLHPHLSAQHDVVERFFDEARSATAIADPGIVQVFDFGQLPDGSAYLVMELLDGEPLDHRLEKLGHLPWPYALRIGRQIAVALAAAHARGIIHRDLKPDNVYLVRDPEVPGGERAKLLDFGIAKQVDRDDRRVKTHAGMLLGTPPYMSPEQCRGTADIDHRSDIYSLGCVLFHLLTGAPPFPTAGVGEALVAHLHEPPQPPSARRPDLPPEVDALVLRCLAKARDDRFPDMTAVASAIDAVLATAASATAPHDAPTLAVTPGGAWPRPPSTLSAASGEVAPRAPRHRAVRWVIAIGTVAAGAALAVALLVGRARPHTPPAHVEAMTPDAAAAVAVDAAVDAADVDAAALVAPPIDAAVDAAPSIDAAVPRVKPPRRAPRPLPPPDPTELDVDEIPDRR